MDNNGQKQIASAIIIAGLLIAGAVLLKGNTGSSGGKAGAQRKLSASTAKTIGLNLKEFGVCLDSGKFKDKIQADIDDGAKIGVNGTPSSFILNDGKVVDTVKGAYPLEEVSAQIKAAATKTKGLGIKIRPVSPDEHIIGNVNAKVVVVEYSDLECPFCKVFHNTMHQIIASNPDVAWVYRQFPIPQLHPKAFHESEASECAWEQGGNEAFWKYIDRIYQITPSNNGLDIKEL